MHDERICAVIDLDAINHNIELTRSKISAGTKIMAVIKADAYGHGAIEIARALSDKVDFFAVAVIEEGIVLRKAGIQNPILILGGTLESRYNKLIRYRLTPTVFTYEAAKKLSDAAIKKNTTINIHIAVDTGMGRIGFQPDEVGEALKISLLPGVFIEGLFTHYAKADEYDKSYSKRQLDKFTSFAAALEEKGVRIPIKHISNSAGIIDFDDSHFNMVRSGIMTYGLYPSLEVNPDFGLRPAMSILARVAHVKTLPAGCGVSYGADYITTCPTAVATVSAGYADGYPRALSNQGRVIIHGQYAPVIGRVCMDQFMIDVSAISGGVKTGDTVTLVGKDGENVLTVEELAGQAHSFNYEFVCGVSVRVPRIYIKNGKFYKRRSYI